MYEEDGDGSTEEPREIRGTRYVLAVAGLLLLAMASAMWHVMDHWRIDSLIRENAAYQVLVEQDQKTIEDLHRQLSLERRRQMKVGNDQTDGVKTKPPRTWP